MVCCEPGGDVPKRSGPEDDVTVVVRVVRIQEHVEVSAERVGHLAAEHDPPIAIGVGE